MAINRLSSVDALAAGDQFAIYSSSNGDDRRAALSLLLEYLQDNLTAQDDKVTQYAAPNATAFNVAIAPPADGDSVFLLLTPTGTFAAGTITLPAVASCEDKQELLVHCSQIVTTLTVAGNGATVNGAPTTLAANGFFRLRFDGVLNSWYRVG
jgi:hypothetical protein